MRRAVLVLGRVVVAAVLFAVPALVRGPVVLPLAAVNASAERVFAQVVFVHAAAAVAHHGRPTAAVHRVVGRFFRAVIVVPGRRLVVVGPSGSVSVQRLRAAEQPLMVAVGGGRPDAPVVTPVGVLVVAAVVAIVVLVVPVIVIVTAAVGRVPALRRFRFFPVFLPVGVRLVAAPVVSAREFAHQPPERFAERFLPLLRFAVGQRRGLRIRRRRRHRSRVRREPGLLVHFLGPAARRTVAGPPFGFGRIIGFRFRRHRG